MKFRKCISCTPSPSWSRTSLGDGVKTAWQAHAIFTLFSRGSRLGGEDHEHNTQLAQVNPAVVQQHSEYNAGLAQVDPPVVQQHSETHARPDRARHTPQVKSHNPVKVHWEMLRLGKSSYQFNKS